jgi:metal-responsive CopG/Arc/MetJ family transcriptional regulator
MAREDCVVVPLKNVPRSLLTEFDELVVKRDYPGGRSEAIRDLMRRAIREKKA